VEYDTPISWAAFRAGLRFRSRVLGTVSDVSFGMRIFWIEVVCGGLRGEPLLCAVWSFIREFTNGAHVLQRMTAKRLLKGGTPENRARGLSEAPTSLATRRKKAVDRESKLYVGSRESATLLARFSGVPPHNK
jgi:hypothetical protein